MGVPSQIREDKNIEVAADWCREYGGDVEFEEDRMVCTKDSDRLIVREHKGRYQVRLHQNHNKGMNVKDHDWWGSSWNFYNKITRHTKETSIPDEEWASSEPEKLVLKGDAKDGEKLVLEME